MWDLILPAYRDAINKETDLDVRSDMMNGLGACVEELTNEIITAADLEQIFAIISKEITEYEERRQERLKDSKDEETGVVDDDQEERDEEMEREVSVLAAVADLVHNLFSVFKANLLPYFNPLVQQFAALLDSSRPYQDRQWGICIFDDVIEFAGDASVQYQQIFFQPILNSLSDKYPEVRQAAAYGCGIMGLFGGQVYAPACAQLIEPLVMAIRRPGARDTEEDSTATENAISAMAKILKHNSSNIDTNAVIPVFLSVLPTVWTDSDEMPFVYDYFCDLVEANHPLVLGENNANLPHIFGTILNALCHGVFAEGAQLDDGCNEELVKSVKARLTTMVKLLHANETVFKLIIASLNMDNMQRDALQKALMQ